MKIESILDHFSVLPDAQSQMEEVRGQRKSRIVPGLEPGPAAKVRAHARRNAVQNAALTRTFRRQHFT